MGLFSWLSRFAPEPLPVCDLCSKPYRGSNQADLLRANLSRYRTTIPNVISAERVCTPCQDDHELSLCQLTLGIYRTRDDMSRSWNGTTAQINLKPYHPLSDDFNKLSPNGFRILATVHKACLKRFSTVELSRRDYIAQRKLEAHRPARVRASADSRDRLEQLLKLRVSQVGGDAGINYHFERKEERYVAGHGSRGNPYYRTDVTYEGFCDAVKYLDSKRPERNLSISRMPATKAEFMEVMGLASGFTLAQLKSARDLLIKACHPDHKTVCSIAERKVAEHRARIINVSYEALYRSLV